MLNVTDTQMLAWISSFLLPLFRVLGLMAAAPILSHRSVSMRMRVAIAAAITLPLSVWIELPAGLDVAAPQGWAMIVREIAIGLLIGFTARLVFASFELAGELIGLQMGLSFAGFFDPGAGQSNAVGRVLSNLSLLTFLSLNGPVILMVAVAQSFQTFPVGLGLQGLQRFDLVTMGAELFATGLSVALPFVILMLFLNAVLGVVSRVAPQLNVFAVGFPLTIGAGLALLATGFPLLEQPLTRSIERLMQLLG
ncbi:MAG: flagellar biosynthetic protein FliR [Burkholderiaceae bacterium]